MGVLSGEVFRGSGSAGDEVATPRVDGSHGGFSLTCRTCCAIVRCGAGGAGRDGASGRAGCRALSTRPGEAGLVGLVRFCCLESIVSLLIEGIAPSPQQVALAELSQDESVRGFSGQACLVPKNLGPADRGP